MSLSDLARTALDLSGDKPNFLQVILLLLEAFDSHTKESEEFKNAITVVRREMERKYNLTSFDTLLEKTLQSSQQ